MYTIYLSLVVTKSLGQPLRSRAIASHDLVSYWCAHHKYGINLHGTLVQISSEIREDHSAYNVCIPCFYGHHSTRSNIVSNHSICVIETKNNAFKLMKTTAHLFPLSPLCIWIITGFNQPIWFPCLSRCHMTAELLLGYCWSDTKLHMIVRG